MGHQADIWPINADHGNQKEQQGRQGRHAYACMCMCIHISAEASMAAGRVDTRPPILKTLSSPRSRKSFLPVTHPITPARLVVRLRERIAPLETQKRCFQRFRVGAPKDPSRTLQGPRRTPQGPPWAPPGRPRTPQSSPQGHRRIPNAPLITSKC